MKPRWQDGIFTNRQEMKARKLQEYLSGNGLMWNYCQVRLLRTVDAGVEKFKRARSEVLVATDVAGRGCM